MTDLLFVYGTLLSGIDHPMGRKLRNEATLLGPASTRGRLYQISWYPGLVPSTETNDMVKGELYRLPEPQKSFIWLDEYEAVDSGEFSRNVGEVFHKGSPLKAWMYIYQSNTVTGKWLIGGDFKEAMHDLF